jgi:hypothetical protein
MWQIIIVILTVVYDTIPREHEQSHDIVVNFTLFFVKVTMDKTNLKLMLK